MEENIKKNTSDHLANERTFLAWIRTSIGIMAFGFVVMKFSLFVKQLSLIVGKPHVIQSKGYSSVIGILLVAVGAITTLLAFMRYKRTEKEITSSNYNNSPLLINLLTGFILLISVCLIFYLVKTS
ncbi:YidH family protein [Niastella sp. OAS944]|uniref:YidH family protein n=1 Tax=Niastella sp. OAS944 TaxID=2664089 RepID=UPI00348890AC|nr:putative membrane protein [Chitinophagaceae bacterium OAS944]